MATEVKTESNSVSSDYHTPRTVEDVTERNANDPAIGIGG
jgi:hypothetical protein